MEFFDVKRDPVAMKRFLALSGGERRVPLICDGDKITIGFDGGT